ncbi:MAG: HPr family phosphocarrier protein [Herbinix sp.]|jgi:phosphocarrier protein|nr:HPr family phosphocarrier protein [Herbinix sp.]
MVKQNIIVVNKSGLHARPASNLVKAATKYKSKITIMKNEKSYEAKSILGILSAGIACGTEITLECDGEDEADALNNLTDLIKSGLGE